MMRSLQCCLFLASICLGCSTRADGPPAVRPGPSKDIPEMSVFAFQAGTWDDRLTINIPATGKVLTASGETTSRWILDGRFLESDAIATTPSGTVVKVRMLTTYNLAKKKYSSWSFSPDGDCSLGEGTWDEKRREWSHVSTHEDGSVSSSITVYPPTGGYITTGQFVDLKGKLMATFKSTSTPRKP